jgi:FixJ family two-component response regulator
MSVGLPIFKPANPTNQERKTDQPICIILVEDDEDYREIVASELSWHGFAVRSFADGASLLGSLVITADADVIVLDWRLPNISGIDLLPQLRQRGVNLPVVFLTSHPQPANEKLAFERGALDFVDKTRGVEILARRLRLVADKPAATPTPRSPSSAAISFSARALAELIGTKSMSASPSVNTTSSIFWRRTSVIMRLTARSTTSNTTKASLPGKGMKDIGRTFDHLSSVRVVRDGR